MPCRATGSNATRARPAPDLGGRCFRSPYHFRARIQSFQAVAASFAGDRPARPAGPSQAKFLQAEPNSDQAGPRKRAWIVLDSFVRFWVFQRVTSNPNQDGVSSAPGPGGTAMTTRLSLEPPWELRTIFRERPACS